MRSSVITNAEIFLLMGSEVLRKNAHEFPGLLKNVRFGVLQRHGELEAIENLKKMGAGITVLTDELLPVSSAMVRDAVASGEPIDGLAPEKVAAHIRLHGLFR